MYDLPFPLAEESRVKVIEGAVQSMVGLYDPSDILLFVPTSWNLTTIESQLNQKISQVFDYDISVNIHLSYDFKHYYLQGLIKLALNKVDLST
ncbi:hypothetical protein ACF3NG_01995 [Aerococcaceae bacterium WGS1372]